MCFTLGPETALLAKYIAPTLSILTSIGKLNLTPRNSKTCLREIASALMSEIAAYYVLLEDRVRNLCFLHFQLIRQP